MPQLTRNSHFVPQASLKPWSKDGATVWAYRILVSHKAVPEWTRRSIRGAAFRKHLYTMVSQGRESDEFERWIEAEYETPAQEAVAKAIRGDPLAPADWGRLARLMAAQDVRTPTSFLETMKYWEREMPELLDVTLKESVRKLEQAHLEGRPITTAPAGTEFFKDIFAITIAPPSDANSDEGSIKVEVVLGRRFWLESQRHLLTNTARVLLKHKWSIAEPAAGATWFASDHPVVRLNYYGDGTYNLRGGWGNPGSEVLMPLSPRHLLFTHLGSTAPDRFTFSPEQTALIQRFLAERAHRWIVLAEVLALLLAVALGFRGTGMTDPEIPSTVSPPPG